MDNGLRFPYRYVELNEQLVGMSASEWIEVASGAIPRSRALRAGSDSSHGTRKAFWVKKHAVRTANRHR